MRTALVSLLVTTAMISATVLGSENPSRAPLTHDAGRLEPDSYRLAVQEQALIWGKGSFPRFIVWPTQAFDIQLKKTVASLETAEEALRLDERNAYARALLGRYFLVPADTYEDAEESWRILFDQDLGLSFPSLFYDVDNKRYFMSHFRKDGIYIYRYGQFGVETMTDLPDESNTLYWEAHAGHIPADLSPAGVIRWSDVKKIKTGNWVWWIELDQKLTLQSDRGKKKSMDTVKVAFLGGVGQFSWHFDWYDLSRGKINIETHTYGPADYNARLRSLVLSLVDPEHRIEAPKPPRPGPGW